MTFKHQIVMSTIQDTTQRTIFEKWFTHPFGAAAVRWFNSYSNNQPGLYRVSNDGTIVGHHFESVSGAVIELR